LLWARFFCPVGAINPTNFQDYSRGVKIFTPKGFYITAPGGAWLLPEHLYHLYDSAPAGRDPKGIKTQGVTLG